MSVDDFEIYGDYVYFCGRGCIPQSKENTCGAVFGYFNIDSLFFHNGNIYLHVFNNPIVSPDSLWVNDRISILTSIEVVVGHDNSPHLAMTGLMSSESGTENAYFVADAWRTTGGGWFFQYATDYTTILTFCDAACTDEAVVAAGIQNENTGNDELFYIPYNRNVGVNNSIFGLPASGFFGTPISVPKYYTSHSVVNPWVRTLIRNMSGDRFAIVCFDTSRLGGSYVVSVYNTYNASPAYRFSIRHNNTTTPWGWAYNKINNALCLVGWGAEWTIYTFREPYTHCDLFLVAPTLLWLDVDDVHGTNQFVFSGTRGFKTENIWVYDYMTSSNCTTHGTRPTQFIDKSQIVAGLTQLVTGESIEMQEESVKVMSDSIDVICK